MSPGKIARDRLGMALVAAQFVLMGTLALLAAMPFLQGRASLPAWALAAAGVLLGLWTLTHNRPGNFHIRPTPREGGHLVHSGPYRWMLQWHPGYAAYRRRTRRFLPFVV